MKKKKISSEHAFGKAYSEWLDTLENLEDFVEGKTIKQKTICYPDKLFEDVKNPEKTEMSAKQILIWAGNAGSLRNSFKFKTSRDNWFSFIENNWKPFSILTFLPFENVYLEMSHEASIYVHDEYPDNSSNTIMLCEQRTLDRDYPELELMKGEIYICITPALHYPDNPAQKRLVTIPAEIHLKENVEIEVDPKKGEFSIDDQLHGMKNSVSPPWLAAFPAGIDGSIWEKEEHDLHITTLFFQFLTLLSSKGIRQTTLGKVKAENVLRRKPKNKRHHPMYEYRILEIGDGSEPPLFDQSVTREAIRKRCHAVRGFFRHYKKPLKSGPNKGKTAVFVKGHWRGDKELGVIRKDYVFANANAR